MRPVGWLMLFVCVLGAAACTGNAGSVIPLDGGCTSCVPDGGRFNIFVVDPTPFSPPVDGGVVSLDGGAVQSQVTGYETIPLFQMHVAPNGNIGIAYVEFSADQTDNKPRPDPSLLNYDVLYTEWSVTTNSPAFSPERVSGSYPVQNFVGVSLDYYNGQPVVGLLGWTAAPGYDATQAYWYQHQGVLSYRNLAGGGTPGTWTQVAVVDNGPAPGADPAAAGTACGGNGSCVQGPITGLYPAVLVDGPETFFTVRNVHFGSSTGTGDFQNSNFDLALGEPGNWQYFGLGWGKPGIQLSLSPTQPGVSRGCSISNNTSGRTAYGNHSSIVLGYNGNPAIISDIGNNEYNSPGTDVFFFEQQDGGSWNCPMTVLTSADTSTTGNFPAGEQSMQETSGPSIAYDSQGVGYAVSISDVSGSGAAYFKTCNPNADAGWGCVTNGHWTDFQPVFQSGSGGYFSSVALNPDTHDPWVAYYFCSSNSAYNELSCPVVERQLQVAHSPYNAGIWYPEPVDNQGAWQTQMLYLTSPTRLVIGYRDPTTGAMKLAVENPP